jgi:hypothetical protein
MLAWEIARQWQEANCMTPFEEILGWHLSGGLIYSTREVFLLAQEVTWDAEKSEIRNQKSEMPNAWFVELAAAGTFSRRGAEAQRNPVREFMRVAPRSHTYVLWCRQAKGRKHNIHSYKWDHLARRVGLPSPSSPSSL